MTTTSHLERRVAAGVEVRVEETPKGPRVVGYAAVFNSRSHDLGGFREEIISGAFADALRQMSNVPLLIEHRDLALADTATRTLRLAEDARGLKIDADLDRTDPDVQRVIPKLKRGTLRSMSFAFRVAAGGDTWENKSGVVIRTIKKIKELVDVSLVTSPAYPDTAAALRALERWRDGWRSGLELDDDDTLQSGRGPGLSVELAEKQLRMRMHDVVQGPSVAVLEQITRQRLPKHDVRIFAELRIEDERYRASLRARRP